MGAFALALEWVCAAMRAVWTSYNTFTAVLPLPIESVVITGTVDV